MINLLHM